LVIVLSVLLRCEASDYPFGIFLLLVIVLSVRLRCKASDYPFGIFLLLATKGVVRSFISKKNRPHNGQK
jgi:hypothetical protein